jgi:hypothetical protein
VNHTGKDFVPASFIPARAKAVYAWIWAILPMRRAATALCWHAPANAAFAAPLTALSDLTAVSWQPLVQTLRYQAHIPQHQAADWPSAAAAQPAPLIQWHHSLQPQSSTIAYWMIADEYLKDV